MLLADDQVALRAVNAAILVYDGAPLSAEDLVTVEAENRTLARHKQVIFVSIGVQKLLLFLHNLIHVFKLFDQVLHLIDLANMIILCLLIFEATTLLALSLFTLTHLIVFILILALDLLTTHFLTIHNLFGTESVVK